MLRDLDGDIASAMAILEEEPAKKDIASDMAILEEEPAKKTFEEIYESSELSESSFATESTEFCVGSINHHQYINK
jgi:hypothetical protein